MCLHNRKRQTDRKHDKGLIVKICHPAPINLNNTYNTVKSIHSRHVSIIFICRQSCPVCRINCGPCECTDNSSHIIRKILCYLRAPESRLRLHKDPGDFNMCAGLDCGRLVHQVNLQFLFLFVTDNFSLVFAPPTHPLTQAHTNTHTRKVHF